MNFLNYQQNLNFIQEQTMESEDKVLENAIIEKNSERTDQILLKDLIKNVEAFLTNKDLRPLSSSLKLIFFRGLSLDRRVSDKKLMRFIPEQ